MYSSFIYLFIYWFSIISVLKCVLMQFCIHLSNMLLFSVIISHNITCLYKRQHGNIEALLLILLTLHVNFHSFPVYLKIFKHLLSVFSSFNTMILSSDFNPHITENGFAPEWKLKNWLVLISTNLISFQVPLDIV